MKWKIATIVFSIGLVLLGTALGPLYICYCAFLSGTVAFERDLRLSEAEAFSLTPEMNPFTVDVNFEYVRQFPVRLRRSNVYDGKLLVGSEELWSGQVNLSLEADSEPTVRTPGSNDTAFYSRVIGPFQIEKEAECKFLLSEAYPPDIEIARMQIEIRRNVMEVNLWLAIGGCLLIPIGIGGILITAFAILKP